MMKKTLKWAVGVSAGALAVMLVLVAVMVVGLSGTVESLASELEQRGVADAVLANAKTDEAGLVSLPVTYYDQKADECVDLYSMDARAALKTRQFGWSECGYYNSQVEIGLVDGALDDEYLPVALGGDLTPNRGMVGSGFWRWYHNMDGVSHRYESVLGLAYDGAGGLKFESEDFYPLDNYNPWGEEMRDGHNHLFTLNLNIPFIVLANGDEVLEIEADDDTWVYVNDELVIDLGGVHEPVRGTLRISDNGEVYAAANGEGEAYAGVRLWEGDSAIIHVFHADRDSGESVFKLELNGVAVEVLNTRIAKNDEAGVEVAAVDGDEVAGGPTGVGEMDGGFAKPLGESVTVLASKKSTLVTATVVQVTALGVVMMGVGVVAMVIIRRVRANKR